MKRLTTFAALLVVALVPVSSSAQALPDPATPDPDTPRVLPIHNSVWIEELTWLEVRDLMAEGKRTVLIPTGGTEQNGPYLVTGKHNVVLRATMEAIARKMGDALVAPVVPFVPEGDVDPPTLHMLYPGSISVTEDTYRALLTDIARSMKTNGFEHVVLPRRQRGESAGNGCGGRSPFERVGRLGDRHRLCSRVLRQRESECLAYRPGRQGNPGRAYMTTCTTRLP